PVVSQPDRSVAATASISSSPIAGGWKERKVVRLDESFGIGRLEAYEIGCAGRPVQGFLAALADSQHGPGAVGAPAKRSEHVAGRPVDANVEDALDRLRLVDPGHLEQLALRRDQETDARTADLRFRRELLGRDFLSERGGERESV